MVSRKAATVYVALVGLVFVFGTSPVAQQLAPKARPPAADSIKLALQQRAMKIFARDCADCHGGTHPKMELNLTPPGAIAAVAGVSSRQIDTLKLVDPGKPKTSYLVMKIRGEKGIKGSPMPLHDTPLTADEIRTIELWIRSLGAPPAKKEGAAAEPDEKRGARTPKAGTVQPKQEPKKE
jgi:mono/diheme cytochrome c family protein